jgi:hypothetical protein
MGPEIEHVQRRAIVTATEGFDTADLKKAKGLLDELSCNGGSWATPSRSRPSERTAVFLEQADPFEPNVSSRSCFFSFTLDNRPPPDVTGKI